LFDIGRKPPTEEEIADEKLFLGEQKAQLAHRRKLSGYVISPAVLMLLIYAWYTTFAGETDEFWKMPLGMAKALLLIVPVLILFLSTGGYWRVNLHTKKLVEQRESLLDPIKQQDLPKMLSLCQKHEKIKAYQDAVTAMGRSLIQGEFLAAKEWTDEQHDKKSDARQGEACAALSRQA
jgi:hypothetical protein